VQAELELGDDTEVATPALDAPQQVRVLVGARAQDPAVRRDDLGGDEARARRPEQTLEPPRAAPERQAGHAGVRHPAAGHRQTVRLRGGVELAPGQAGAEATGATLDVDLHPLHRTHVDDDAVVAARVAGARVPAPADGDHEVLLAGMVQRELDVLGARASRDQQRSPVDRAVEQAARLVVAGIAGPDELAAERLRQRRKGGHRRPPDGSSVEAPLAPRA
jgi:hypothetical protein